MAKFRPIKKPRMALERWKDEKLEKNGKKGFLIPRKIRKRKKTHSKKEKKEKKRKRKILFKWKCIPYFLVLANFD